MVAFRVERSSDQVIKPVNLEALSKWVGNIPEDVVRDMADIAPMLSVLGYDPYANPPDYGKPDSWVQDNTFKVSKVFLTWLQLRSIRHQHTNSKFTMKMCIHLSRSSITSRMIEPRKFHYSSSGMSVK